MSETAGANTVYAEVPVQASVSSSRKTPDEIVAIGVKLWEAVKKSGVAPEDDAGNDALLDRLQGEFRDFAVSFPLIMRWIVQARQFSSAALRKYLLGHTAVSSREEFLALQAEYLVILFREANRHPSEALVRRYRSELISQLKAEDETFLAVHREAEAEVARQDAVVDRDRRRVLYESLVQRRLAAQDSAAQGGAAQP